MPWNYFLFGILNCDYWHQTILFDIVSFKLWLWTVGNCVSASVHCTFQTTHHSDLFNCSSPPATNLSQKNHFRWYLALVSLNKTFWTRGAHLSISQRQCTLWLSIEIEVFQILKIKGLVFYQFWSRSHNSFFWLV